MIASTASPYKFAGHVLSSISQNVPEDDYDQLEALEKVSGVTAPAPLVALKEKPVRFTGSICKEEMEHTVMEMLGLA